MSRLLAGRAAWVPLALLVLLHLLTLGDHGLGRDQQHLLYGGWALAQGQELYVDYVDADIPGVILFHQACIRVGALLGVSGASVLFGSAVLWCLFLFGAAARALEARGVSGPAAALYATALYAFATGYPPDWVFAQRDFFAGAAVVPMVLLSGGADAGRPWLARAVGALMGLSLWLKPQLGILPAAVLAKDLWADRRALLGPLYQGLFAGGIAGSASLLWMGDPENFWRWTLGWGLGGYQSFEKSWADALGRSWRFCRAFLLAFVVTAPLGGWLAPAPLRRSLVDLTVLSAAGFALVFLQRKGWLYHHFPVILLLVAAVALALLVLLLPGERRGEPGRPRRVAALLVAVLVAGAWGWGRRILANRAGAPERAALQAEVLAGIPEGEPVTVFGAEVPGGPVTSYRLERAQGMRFNWMCYLIPYYREAGSHFHRTVPTAGLEEASEGEAAVLRLMLADLERSRPAALVFDHEPSELLPFPTEEYFLGVRELAALLRRDYVRVGELMDGRYVRYLRRDLAGEEDP